MTGNAINDLRDLSSEELDAVSGGFFGVIGAILSTPKEVENQELKALETIGKALQKAGQI